jgi:2-methylcitrate dehydratase PrpD
MTDLAENIAAFITDLKWEEVPAEMQDHARNRLLDAISTAVASRGVATTKAIVAAGEALATTGTCTVLPTGRTTGAGEAALMNGTAVHSILFEDIHFHSSDHPGAVNVPAALAAAESASLVTGRPATIGDLLRGILIGYEVHLRMGVIAATGIKARKLRTTSMFGTIGAAAGAASVWGLPKDVVANSLSMAANLSFGFLEGFAHGTAEPYVQAGVAARQGLLAVHLARSGVAIGDSAFEGPAGFLQGFADIPAGTTTSFPDEWQIGGVSAKPYPISGGKISSADSAVAAHEQGIDGRKIVSVRALLQPGVKEFPGGDLEGPFHTYAAAQDSTQFCIAAGLLGRDLSSLSYVLEQFDDPEVEALTHRIELISDPGRTKTRLLIELEGGQHEEVEVDWSDRQQPTIEKMTTKLHSLTDGFWNSATVDGIVALTTGRTDAPISDLSRLLRSTSV